MIILNNESKIV